jgi:uncharacterized membrane protein
VSQDLIVITFDETTQASAALKAVRDQQAAGLIHLEDTAIVRKDDAGQVHTVNEVSSATEVGAVAGGALGLMLTFMFPIVGLAVGAASGAAIGALLGHGVDGKFLKEVTENLQPGKSALFLVFNQLNPLALRALEPFPGHLVQTTLPSDLEDRLRHALHDQQVT